MSERIYGIANKWKEQCSAYQEMKERSIKLLEHPDATEQELLEVARLLRETRKAMNSMKDLLNASYPKYVFDLDGKAAPKRNRFVFNPKTDVVAFVPPRSLAKSTTPTTV